MRNSLLLDRFKKVERIAKGSRIRRMLFNPLKYSYAIFFRLVCDRLFKVSQLVKTKLFFNEGFYVRLPAGTDIFITGGKSDDSELRLTKFFIRNLGNGDC